MNCRLRVFILIGVALPTASIRPNSQHAQTKPKYYVEITAPDRDGLQKGLGMDVEGKASIAGGEHLWVLCRRVDFQGVWWPQSEGEIDQKTNRWKASASFGEQRDIGKDFDLAVIVVNEEQHLKLQNYRENAMLKNQWTPIKMPETTLPPQYRKVKKVSHD